VTDPTTPRDLIRITYDRFCQLVLLNGALEDYLLFSFTKVVSFGIGLGLGYWLWGIV
tara:strand:+ start:16640 stop:16810 length:171 start_codon:yes stop_codon:yes gene_type:complete